MTTLAFRSLVALALLGGLLGCSEDRNFVLVSVMTSSGELDGYAELEVAVRRPDGKGDELAYAKRPAAPAKLTPTTPVTFSVGFSRDFEGVLDLGVIPLDAAGQALGFGRAPVTIERGKLARVELRVTPGASAPSGWPRRVRTAADGGRGDGGDGGDGGKVGADAGSLSVGPSPSSGIDPSSTNRCEAGAANTCTMGRRCVLACMSTSVGGTCADSGARQPGEACDRDADCAAGTQCFSYGCASGVAKICGRTCTSDGECSGGTRCFSPISCGGQATGFKVCSNACDPTGAAATGCGAGLRCILDETGVTECRCVAPTRVGLEGARCTFGADCQVGLTCVSNDKQSFFCRKICRRGEANACGGGLECRQLGEPPISATYGICE